MIVRDNDILLLQEHDRPYGRNKPGGFSYKKAHAVNTLS